MYTKPHLTYTEQLELMARRGLRAHDNRKCIESLRRIGYYRLSGYAYPFREIKPEENRTSPLNFRYDNFLPSYYVEDAVALADFDRKLRGVILEGIDIIEIGLRTQVAYIAGSKDKYFHLNRNALDSKACGYIKKGDTSDLDAYDRWLDRYEDLIGQAKSEDFVRHHLAQYGRDVPIWIATEFLDFGALSRLYSMLDDATKSQISKEMGVASGKVLDGWFKAINYLRNKSAHFSRMWNRRMTYKIARPNVSQVASHLHHLQAVDAEHLDKIYCHLAAMGYLITYLEPDSRWRAHVRDIISKFPAISGISPRLDMGFPEDWKSFDLWNPMWRVAV